MGTTHATRFLDTQYTVLEQADFAYRIRPVQLCLFRISRGQCNSSGTGEAVHGGTWSILRTSLQ
jgi:hypothetical protein